MSLRSNHPGSHLYRSIWYWFVIDFHWFFIDWVLFIFNFHVVCSYMRTRSARLYIATDTLSVYSHRRLTMRKTWLSRSIYMKSHCFHAMKSLCFQPLYNLVLYALFYALYCVNSLYSSINGTQKRLMKHAYKIVFFPAFLAQLRLQYSSAISCLQFYYYSAG